MVHWFFRGGCTGRMDIKLGLKNFFEYGIQSAWKAVPEAARVKSILPANKQS